MEQVSCNLNGEALRSVMLEKGQTIVKQVRVMFINREKLLDSKLKELADEERKVQEEREHGDTSENVAYTIAVAAVSALRLEISSLEHSIQRYNDFMAASSQQEVSAGGVATVGSVVCISDVGAGSDNDNPPTWVIKIYPSGIGSARNGGISADTPLGLALCGHRAGETISFKAPRGDMRYYIKEVL